MFKYFMLLVSLKKWFGIVLSPTIIGCFLGWIVYFNKPDRVGLILGVVIVLVGLFLGIKLAEKVWKEEKTDEFLTDIATEQPTEVDEEPKDR